MKGRLTLMALTIVCAAGNPAVETAPDAVMKPRIVVRSGSVARSAPVVFVREQICKRAGGI
ncbi:MAG: hypothetical protein KIS78_24245, partial [Labilithrix sp.]|nr:hypothetical protein [Labilithrix sp.]